MSHTGKNMANTFASVLEEFQIQDKVSTIRKMLGIHGTHQSQVLAITCDNASNNDTMLKELMVLIPSFRGAASQTRCFAHVVNLVVKSIMGQFGGRKDKPETTTYLEDTNDELLPDSDLEDEVMEDIGDGGESDMTEVGGVEEEVTMGAEWEKIGKDGGDEWLDDDVRPVSGMLTKVSHSR